MSRRREGTNTMDMMRMKAILLLTAVLAFVTAPFWSGGFNGFEADQFPVPQIDPPAQPAGYAFAIWGVIYVWLAVMAVVGLFARSDEADWDRPRWALIVSMVIGSSWLAVAQISPIWATILIWAMLLSALAALLSAPRRDLWLARYPIELYAGWLTAASCVSIALTGAGHGLGFSSVGWAYVAIALAICIAASVLWLTRAPFYALSVAWALVAVIVANWSETRGVALFAALGVGLVAVLALRGISGRAAPGD